MILRGRKLTEFDTLDVGPRPRTFPSVLQESTRCKSEGSNGEDVADRKFGHIRGMNRHDRGLGG